MNVARRDLGDRLADVSAVLGEAIRAGLDHRDEALAYAEQFGRGIDRETADRFVAMYVNELTCDYGEIGPRARSTSSCGAPAPASTAVYA